MRLKRKREKHKRVKLPIYMAMTIHHPPTNPPSSIRFDHPLFFIDSVFLPFIFFSLAQQAFSCRSFFSLFSHLIITKHTHKKGVGEEREMSNVHFVHLQKAQGRADCSDGFGREGSICGLFLFLVPFFLFL
ncbi:hypothetical protein M431DRAFT_250074 [Trichoderma harzianum CBS 226.95]|uniref:Transmembrane protein n=1 Tax=Trichoderma harzianum CBS 226.95 TaxID=983964 RepID=A0A2T3ZZV6_TRIHA|nr:hypothetical protein M431DRAFT_250074 [Trichoderma harzianum CBS 226.95]PTB50345.1 hypothetical protein M431DRAFT_250074 [Trichoderma harzianum CBS 226.95]